MGHCIGWIQASSLAATAVGRGGYLARKLQEWIVMFINDRSSLPLGRYSTKNMKRCLVQDEDFALDLKQLLLSLNTKYVAPKDVLQYVNQPDVLVHFGLNKPISERTARRWFHLMKYRYTKEPSG